MTQATIETFVGSGVSRATLDRQFVSHRGVLRRNIDLHNLVVVVEHAPDRNGPVSILMRAVTGTELTFDRVQKGKSELYWTKLKRQNRRLYLLINHGGEIPLLEDAVDIF